VRGEGRVLHQCGWGCEIKTGIASEPEGVRAPYLAVFKVASHLALYQI